MDSTRLLLSAALAGIMGAATTAGAEDAPAAAHVKCYGIAKAGQNDCGNASGTHGCKGEAKVDNDPGEYALVGADADCTKAGGKTTPPEAAK